MVCRCNLPLPCFYHLRRTMISEKLLVCIIVMIKLLNPGVEGQMVCSCYEFVSSPELSWLQAKESCHYSNKTLVVMETEEEWRFIENELKQRVSFPEIEWMIGLFKNETNGNWTWVNGKPLTINKWQPRKPGGENEKYAIISKEFPPGRLGSFNSITSILQRGWICEEESVDCSGGVCWPHIQQPTTASKALPTNGTSSTTATSRVVTSEGQMVYSCYEFVSSQKLLWQQAKEYCHYNNKMLVVMETEEEWLFIENELKQRVSLPNNEWLIGLFKNMTTGNWTWVNGKPLTINKWEPGKPAGYESEKYALISKEYPPGRLGSFNSISSTVERGWICEEESVDCSGGVCWPHIQQPTPTTKALPTNGTSSTTATSRVVTSASTLHCRCSYDEPKMIKESMSSVLVISLGVSLVFFFVISIILGVMVFLLRKRNSNQKYQEPGRCYRVDSRRHEDLQTSVMSTECSPPESVIREEKEEPKTYENMPFVPSPKEKNKDPTNSVVDRASMNSRHTYGNVPTNKQISDVSAECPVYLELGERSQMHEYSTLNSNLENP